MQIIRTKVILPRDLAVFAPSMTQRQRTTLGLPVCSYFLAGTGRRAMEYQHV